MSAEAVMHDPPTTDASNGHDHILLFAGTNSSGGPVHELVPAVPVDRNVYDIKGTPALVLGCAAADRIRVSADGSFEVVARGGNIALMIFPKANFIESNATALRASFAAMGGITETAPDGRFLIVTVPANAGFSAIERVAKRWADANDADWHYGNVYDEDGRPLNWWRDS